LFTTFVTTCYYFGFRNFGKVRESSIRIRRIRRRRRRIIIRRRRRRTRRRKKKKEEEEEEEGRRPSPVAFRASVLCPRPLRAPGEMILESLLRRSSSTEIDCHRARNKK
jgi:hypothetical protein